MNNLLKTLPRLIWVGLLTIFLILIISALPSLFSFGRQSNIQYYTNSEDPDFMGNKLYRLHIHPENFWRKPFRYFRKIKAGKVFVYKEGKTTRYYLKQAPRYFKTSFFFLSITGVVSLLIGIFVSLQSSDKRRNPVFYEFLSFITIFPDFILIFIIQFIFFYINKVAGSTLVRTHTLQASDRAVLLPLLVMTCYPTLYIIRTIGNQLKEVYSQPYIGFARAKGLSPVNVRYFHIGPAAVHFIRGDLHRILSILFANLFIMELMFNNKGLTSFLFNNIHEYSATVNTVILMMILYLTVYICLYASLTLLGVILRRGSR